MSDVEMQMEIDAGAIGLLKVTLTGEVKGEPSIAGNTHLYVMEFECWVTHADEYLLKVPINIKPILKNALQEQLQDKLIEAAMQQGEAE